MSTETVRNRVLLALPASSRDHILHHCKHVEFPAGHTLYLAEEPVQLAYFIDSGLVSLIKTMQNGRRAEIGAIGTEGVVGLFAALGLPYAIAEYVVQIPVSAWCMNIAAMRQEITSNYKFHDVFYKYLFLFADQIAQTAACNRVHPLYQRCCRWLLFAHDNAFSDQFNFTHEFFASLLGVQRPSLTLVANSLQKRGLIKYKHGHLTILDRRGLEKASCECYETIRQHRDQAFGHTERAPIGGGSSITRERRAAANFLQINS